MNENEKLLLIENFISVVREDPRITAVHISLFIALVYLCEIKKIPVVIAFSYQVMPVCKISGSSTYHRCLRELNEYGYINYFPSYNHNKGSRVEFGFKK